MSLRPRILVVDDEPPIRRLLRTGLASQGFDISEAATGADAIAALGMREPGSAAAPFDLVVLDIGLPDVNGFDVLAHLRGRGDATPVVILSSRDDEPGKVRAFDGGADDYVTKPFGMNELIARIRTALRHGLQAEGARPLFLVDGLSVDLVRRIVRLDGAEVKLSPKEYDLLRLLVLNAGKVLTHAFLLRKVWGATTDPQQLRVYVRQLRHKIERTPDQPSFITTEVGVGYRLRAPDA